MEHIVNTIGGITFLLGAIMALSQHILKRLLAYTTVSALGAMVADWHWFKIYD